MSKQYCLIHVLVDNQTSKTRLYRQAQSRFIFIVPYHSWWYSLKWSLIWGFRHLYLFMPFGWNQLDQLKAWRLNNKYCISLYCLVHLYSHNNRNSLGSEINIKNNITYNRLKLAYPDRWRLISKILSRK